MQNQLIKLRIFDHLTDLKSYHSFKLNRGKQRKKHTEIYTILSKQTGQVGNSVSPCIGR